MRAAIYARVSTQEKKKLQDPFNQVPHLQQMASQRGFTLTSEYIDRESAGEGKLRPEFERMMQDASLQKFDVILFWSLDRFSREGVFETLEHLRKLSKWGVEFLSFTEQYLDSTGAFKDAIIAIIAAIAKQERTRISERVRAGMQRRKLEGATFGRKPIHIDPELLELAIHEGKTMREMARMFRVSAALISEHVRQWRENKKIEADA